MPVVILNDYEENDIFDKCIDINCKDFILVSIKINNWNDDLTPWKCEPIYKGDKGYLGNADDYLNELINEIIPDINNYINNTINKEIDYYILAGYSLAGLFALYSCFKTNIFKRIVCASSSFWYPKFLDYVKSNNINSNFDKIYFSLGNIEKNTKNNYLKEVENNTIEIYNILNKKINCIYEINEGNHFKDEDLRICKGIKWILEE